MMQKVIQFQMGFTGLEVRSGKIVIEGYASTPTIDRYNSIVQAASFDAGLKNYLKNPVILLGHDDTKPIGVMADSKIDENGLRIKAEITKNTDGVFEDIKEGRTKGFSIGFIPLKRFYMDKKSGKNLKDMTEEEYNNLDADDVVRVINEIDLVEISVVNVPANPQALFTVSKALRKFFAEMETRKFLDSQRQVLVNDQDNPFLDMSEEEDQSQDEPKDEPAEQINKPIEEATEAEQETPQEVKAEEVPQEEPNESEQSEDSATTVSTEGEVTGESPEAPQEHAQSEVEQLRAEIEKLNVELSQERSVSDEALKTLDEVKTKFDKFVSNKAVNSPKVYTPNVSHEDPLLANMRKAKYGN